jgi:site-specific DNA-methyltransferase (adenine-specific)
VETEENTGVNRAIRLNEADRMTRKIGAFKDLAFDYASNVVGGSRLIHADCFEWLSRVPENSLHAVVTDPPYGVKEYDFDQLEKRANGNGGIWRIPPSFDGHTRAPLPRFTALDESERERLRRFFIEWSRVLTHALRPGGHVFIASNAFLAPLVYTSLVEGGLEFRGQIIRLVRTLRGGDRPKNAEEEFAEVSSMPRGCYEPWGLLRKPMPAKMRVSDCLREFQTGGLRRTPEGKPFGDLIPSERTPKRERVIANHPSLKPQSFLRRIVYASLPMGVGVVADPFMGSGSTVAAAEAVGVTSIGIERFVDYFQMAARAIPKLAAIHPDEPSSANDEIPPNEQTVVVDADRDSIHIPCYFSTRNCPMIVPS